MRFVLVRHCQSRIDPSTSTSTWGLTALGREQADALAVSPLLAEAELLASGPEPKMIETLTRTAAGKGIDITIDKAFAETASQGWLSETEFTATVKRFFDKRDATPAPGWETSSAAADRFLEGVRRLQASHVNGDVAICSGGRSLTSLLLRLGVVDSKNAHAYWQRIQMPDLAVVDLTEHRARAIRHFGIQA